MLRLYIIGISILAIAIIVNGLVIKIGLKSWYDLFELIKNNGTNTFKLLSVLDYLWLFLCIQCVLLLGIG